MLPTISDLRTHFHNSLANGSNRDISSDFSEQANISGAVKSKRLSEQVTFFKYYNLQLVILVIL